MQNLDYKNIDVHIGSRLRYQRCFLGFTQKDVADVIGVKFQQIQKYESGKNKITACKLYKLSKLLKVDVSYFFSDFNDLDSSFREDGEDFIFDTVTIKPSVESLKLVNLYNKISNDDTKKKLLKFLNSIIQEN